MINPLNLSNDQIEQMLTSASKSLGMSKEELKTKLMNNDINSILDKAPIQNRAIMSKILNDPKLMKRFLQFQKERGNL